MIGSTSRAALARGAAAKLGTAIALALACAGCSREETGRAAHAAEQAPAPLASNSAAASVEPSAPAAASYFSPPVRADAPEPAALAASGPGREATPEPPLVLRMTEPSTGDWPAIEARGVLRVLVAQDRTNFFIADGRVRGFEYEMFAELEKHIAKGRSPSLPPLEVAFVPEPFDQLLPSLLAGRGDVAAGSLTVTPEREQQVAFAEPYMRGVAQIVVANASAPALGSIEDLSGKSVCVADSTSYIGSLERLNSELTAAGRSPAKIEVVGEGLATEDMLELVHVGAFPYTIADRHIAELWSRALDGLRLHPELEVARGGELAWAVRKENPELRSVLSDFARSHQKGTLLGNVLFQRYFEDTQWIVHPLPDLESGRLAPFLEPLMKLSKQYGFDWRLMAAQAYQESRLDPHAKSSAGAIGLMQLLPATAREMGFADLSDPVDNLHAGIKYMAWLRDTYFSDPKLSQPDRIDFALAAYNAGPGRVRRWRQEALGRGVDPDRWFGQIEVLALEDVGLQPVRYVGNINKYYVIFTRMLEDWVAKQAELRAILERARLPENEVQDIGR